MTNETTPLKRSPQLAVLSRDHHLGLLFVWKLRQGIGNSTSIDTLKEFVKCYWKNHFRLHFRSEEQTLLPYIKSEAMAQQLKQEHRDIESLFESLDGETERAKFSILAKFIENHIRFEERQLFMFLQKTLSADELDTIAAALHEIPDDTCGWIQEFWVRK
ncbi:MAG TPA: hemerythrin domain-containing protein [Chitinophagaceae bacterium]|jgi:hemerythrin-like domain-containing protein|nr:hemerythrin domain-containing protein [Chitinophagaceae bacterium]